MADDGLVHWDFSDIESPVCDQHSSITRMSENPKHVTCTMCLDAVSALGSKANIRRSSMGHSGGLIGSPAHVELWDAINAFTVASGGRADAVSGERMNAVVRIEQAVAARAAELTTQRARGRKVRRTRG